VKVFVEMRDEDGALAMFEGDGEWVAFDLKNVEKVKKFQPFSLHKITCHYDDGGTWIYPIFAWTG